MLNTANRTNASFRDTLGSGLVDMAGKDQFRFRSIQAIPKHCYEDNYFTDNNFEINPFGLEPKFEIDSADSLSNSTCTPIELSEPESPGELTPAVSLDPLYNQFFGKKRKQGTHGNQDPKKARQAQVQKWSRSSDREGQAASLLQFLQEQDAEGTIKLWVDENSSLPHGIAGFEVKDVTAFKSRRISWFERKENQRDCKPSPTLDPLAAAAQRDNSVNQAFRRNGLVPQRKHGCRGFDWEAGRMWSFDVETFRKYGSSSKVKHVCPAVAVAVDGPAAGAAEGTVEGPFVCYLSKAIMMDPVVVPETGISYERAYIEAWLAHTMTDPRTGAALQSQLLIRNVALANCIAIHRAALLSAPLRDNLNHAAAAAGAAARAGAPPPRRR